MGVRSPPESPKTVDLLAKEVPWVAWPKIKVGKKGGEGN